MYASANTVQLVDPLIRRLGWLLLPVILLTACDRDPYRIGIEPSSAGGVVIHFANCDDDRVFRVSLSTSGRQPTLLWEAVALSADGERIFEFPVGSEPPGFEVTVPLVTDLQGTRYLVAVDSTFLEDQRYAYERALLLEGYVLAGNDQHFTVEGFKAGALCD